MFDVRWSEPVLPDGLGAECLPSWAVIGARVRAAALLATTLHLAFQDNQAAAAVENRPQASEAGR